MDQPKIPSRDTRLKRDVEQLISEHGLRSIIGELARYCYSPPHQLYSQPTMATLFRRLNKVYEYIEGKN